MPSEDSRDRASRDQAHYHSRDSDYRPRPNDHHRPRDYGRGRDRSPSFSQSPPPRRRRRNSPSLSRSPSRRQSPSPDRRSRRDDRQRQPYRRRSPSRERRRPRSRSPDSDGGGATRRSHRPLPSQDDSYHRQHGGREGGAMTRRSPPPPKEKPNFKNSGLLAAEANKVTVGQGKWTTDITLKYHEPPEARKPPASQPWKMYIFKGGAPDPLDTVPLHLRSCWLLGRETAVADIPAEHPSCSKQHAVLQFRHVEKKDEYGEVTGQVKLYLLDLESSNGSYLNGGRVGAARYVECRSGDVIRLADSTREYVLLLPPDG